MGTTTTRGRSTRATAGEGQARGRVAAVAVGAVALLAVLAWVVTGTVTDGEGAGATVEEFLHVHGLEIPAWGDGAVYVSTHQGAFRIDGDDWSWVSETPHDFMGFAAHPDEEGVLFSSGHPAPGSDLDNPIGFMVSSDGGVTWEVRSMEGEADFHAMSVAADGGTVYGFDVAGQPGLHRSVDAGQSWQRLEAARLMQAGGTASLAVSPADPEVVLAGTDTGLLRSGDAGETWEVLLDAPTTAVTFDPVDPDRLVAFAAAEAGIAIESRDAGESWQPLGLVLDADAAGHVAVDPTDPDTIWIGTFGESLWRTADGGERWEQLADEGVPTDS